MQFLQSFFYKSFFFAVCVSLFSHTAMCASAQQPAPDTKPAQSSAPSAATPSPAPGLPAPAQPPQTDEGKNRQVPGLDPKSGLPYYETIQEDWSSLQIGTSKLEPMPPRVGQVEEQPSFTRVMARVQWRPGDPIDLWIILPKGVKQPAAVLYLYGPSANPTARFRDDRWCQRVTSGGMAAIGFEVALTGDRFHDRPMKQWLISELQEALGSTVHDVKFILDYMDKSKQFDMTEVGMFGEGVGGSIAIMAAAADPRIKAVDAIEPWGDWPIFLANSPVVEPDPNHADFVKPEFLKKVAPVDPLKWLPELKIPVRIQQVKESDTVPLECKEALKAAAPKQAEVVRFATLMDAGKREGGGKLFDWIKAKLQPAAKPVAGTNSRVAISAPAGSNNAAKN